MIAKVILGTMTNARKLVSIAERISCDVELAVADMWSMRNPCSVF